ncbi:MAG: hypothetical protein J5565_03135 [Muribaculaceae bacterium]|nr:hypothetical protein [Muribaculaceae bacterium]
MEQPDKNKCDVVINHNIGCQFIYFLVALALIAFGVIYIIYVRKNNWHSYLLSPLLILGGGYGAYMLVMSFIKERIHKIPAMVITSKSLILSRKKDEYNEIPFSVVDHFGYRRQRTGRRNTTYYITIQYKEQTDSTNEKFERVDQIDCSGLNIMNYKLLNLLKERLQAYNERQL